MEPAPPEHLDDVLEALTGQHAPFPRALDGFDFPADGLGCSQLNELLLLLGYDRVTDAFFQFLVDGTLDYKPPSQIRSFQDLKAGVERARQLSLLFFGNVKFGFKKLARDVDELSSYHAAIQPIDPDIFMQRHDPIQPLAVISPSETYYLGYMVQKELAARLKSNPNDQASQAETMALDRVCQTGSSISAHISRRIIWMFMSQLPCDAGTSILRLLSSRNASSTSPGLSL
jgi:hypothetical protein